MSLSSRGSSSATRTVCFLVVMGTFRTTLCNTDSNLASFRQERQRERKRAPLALALALRPDPPAVRFDETLADRQADSRSTDHPRHLALDSVKTVENAFELRCGHTQPLVG